MRFFSISNGLSKLSAFMLLATVGCSHGNSVKINESSDFFGASKVHRFKLSNGLKVLVLEDHSSPTFSYQTWFKVGSRDEEVGLTGLAHLFEHMMFKQTKNHADGDFHKFLENAGANGENAFTSRDYTGYVQSLPSGNLDLIASLESDRMVNLLVIDESLSKEKEVVQNERRFRNENSPDGQLYEKIYELAYKKHNYRWPVIGFEADIQGAKREDCEKFYKRFYAPNNATIVVVGDVSANQVLNTVIKHYGKLPASKIDRKKSPVEPTQTTERRERIPLKINVQKLMVAYHIPEITSFEFPALEVVRNILVSGKGSRLYRKLVDAGIASSVDIGNGEHADPGLFSFYINMQKGRTAEQAIAIIDKEVKDLLSGKIQPDEIERAVSMSQLALFTEMSGNFNKAQFLGFYETVAGRFERGVDVVNALKAIDKRMITQVVKAYLNKNNRSIAIGVPK